MHSSKSQLHKATGSYLICILICAFEVRGLALSRSTMMATLPRSPRYPPGPPSIIANRPVSEFDAGINTSAAWTEHLETGSPTTSISRARSKRYLSESDAQPLAPKNEAYYEPDVVTRSARALYSFEGKPEFRELSVVAGDEVEVVKEDVGEGWSLVQDSTGETGLLPRAYYTVCFTIL